MKLSVVKQTNGGKRTSPTVGFHYWQFVYVVFGKFRFVNAPLLILGPI